MKTAIRSASIVILAAMLGAGMYFGRMIVAGPNEPGVPGVEPQVEGRIVIPIFGETSSGESYFAACEADAVVNLEGRTVTKVIREGAYATQVKPGVEIVELLDRPTRDGAEPAEAGPLGQIHTDQEVYWDKSGQLHAGCAPESVITPAKPEKSPVAPPP